MKAVQQLVQDVFDDVWSDYKKETLNKYHTKDFIILEHGEVWTNDTIADWCVRAAKRDQGVERINSFDFFKTEKTADRIWMAYHNYATFKGSQGESKMQWLESVIAIKTDSGWKLQMMHSTRLPRKN
ncbi:nuclear transport factor 2 family protein [Spongiivirga citrea]|uniref:Nuclear transport factor 2 family protein n=1 Tax=Spongiivirga citrea TaxID=1481457 RepID=A0A6M0CK91_9FLAO|nr:nuclear transport factor 2 family protein [Spongiivirga citrea]